MNCGSVFATRSRTTSASSVQPLPPSLKRLATTASSPSVSQCFCNASTSSAVSVGKWLIATTSGWPKLRMFSTCFSMFASPRLIAADVGLADFGERPPPCIFSARMVATSTVQRGREAAVAAVDVEELLGAELEGEPGLGDDESA